MEKDSIEANYAPTFHEDEVEPGTPTDDEQKRITEGYKHEEMIHLDVEDWFIHAHILFDKFAKLICGIYLLIFNERKKFYDKFFIVATGNTAWSETK